MTRDEIAVALAACSRDRIVLARDLRGAGLAGKEIARACTTGQLERWAMGVYVVSGTPDDARHRGRAALAAAGTGAVLSGLWAARWWGLRWVPDRPEGTVMVLVPSERRRRGSTDPWILVRRKNDLASLPTFLVGGMPVPSIAQVVVDASREVTSLRDVRGLVLGAVANRLCTVAEILEIVDRGAPAKTAWVRRACRDAERGAASPPEAEAADEMMGCGHPFYVNCAVYLNGVLLGIADIWLVGRGTGAELDSREFHEEPDLLEATFGRDKGFTRAGLSLDHWTPKSFRADRQGFVRSLIAEADRRTALGLTEPPGLTLKPSGPLLQ